jgi:hypothetical protein
MTLWLAAAVRYCGLLTVPDRVARRATLNRTASAPADAS